MEDCDDTAALAAAGLPVSFGKVKKQKPKRKHYCRGVTPVAAKPAAPVVKSDVPFAHQRVVAPMVGASDLAFRLLCRRYGADLCYTEMFNSAKFVEDEEYRNSLFFSQILRDSTIDRPLIAQFCGNDADVITAAAKYVEPYVDAVDINLGCPQSRAQKDLVGAFLLDREHWPKIAAMVTSLKAALKIPVTCKIRLLTTLAETLELCELIQSCGCDMLAVHGRTRGSVKRRRAGAANLDAIAEIVKRMRIPVLTNGNVRKGSHVVENQTYTGAQGVMVAEAAMADPGIFLKAYYTATATESIATSAAIDGTVVGDGGRAQDDGAASDSSDEVISIGSDSDSDRDEPATKTRATASPDSKPAPAADAPPQRISSKDAWKLRRNAARARIGRIAMEYLDLAEKHPPPLFEYTRRHVMNFLGRSGKGARTRYR